VRTILPAGKSSQIFSYKEVQFKNICLPVKTYCLPAQNLNEILVEWTKILPSCLLVQSTSSLLSDCIDDRLKIVKKPKLYRKCPAHVQEHVLDEQLECRKYFGKHLFWK